MQSLSEKYGYSPDMEAIERSLNLISTNIGNISSDEVYMACFSMMDLTTLKTNDTAASVAALVEKVNAFSKAYPQWPLPRRSVSILISLRSYAASVPAMSMRQLSLHVSLHLKVSLKSNSRNVKWLLSKAQMKLILFWP